VCFARCFAVFCCFVALCCCSNGSGSVCAPGRRDRRGFLVCWFFSCLHAITLTSPNPFTPNIKNNDKKKKTSAWPRPLDTPHPTDATKGCLPVGIKVRHLLPPYHPKCKRDKTHSHSTCQPSILPTSNTQHPTHAQCHTYIHTYIHTHIHTYIHTYMYTCIRTRNAITSCTNPNLNLTKHIHLT